jgi:hypothetical protein
METKLRKMYILKDPVTLRIMSNILKIINLSISVGVNQEKGTITQSATDKKGEAFSCKSPPTLPLADYLLRILQYGQISKESYVYAMSYIDRTCITITPYNCHKLLLIAIVVASKFYDDTFFNNGFYSKVGGLTCKELNCLEIDFLFLIHFNLHISEDDYKFYYELLTKR